MAFQFKGNLGPTKVKMNGRLLEVEAKGARHRITGTGDFIVLRRQ